MIKKFLGLPATVKLSIVTLTIFLAILFAWQPIVTGGFLLIIGAFFSIVRLAYYFAEGK